MYAIRQQLRPYQVEAGRAILDSVMNRRGLTFSVEIARQGGKNELSAQLEVLLLTLFMGIGGNMVKCSPTFRPQTLNSLLRLQERLDDAGYTGVWGREHGYMVRLGKARTIFFSANEASHVVGATAHILLEVDESQDVDPDKYQKEFRPMGSTTNVTTVHYGTAWDESTLLEQVKQENLERERQDGIRRHFQYDWQEVAKHNPAYLAYVQQERQRLGENHPLFTTQYRLQPLHGGGRLFTAQHRALMVGDHARLHQPTASGRPHPIYVAGIDLAGAAEAGEDVALRAPQPRRDSTVVTVAEVHWPQGHLGCAHLPQGRLVEHYRWTGVPHAELFPQLVARLQGLWRCRRVVVDATGVGEGVASFLESALGRSVVVPFKFTAPSKSHLGFQLLAAVNGGRLKMYASDGSQEHGEFWRQVELARSAYRPNQTMNFYLDTVEGHDDFLMSLALVVEAVAGYTPRGAHGRLAEN